MPLLAHVDWASGLLVRKPRLVCCERLAPGEIWFMWTSRGSDASETAAVGVSTAEALPRAAQQARGEAKPLEHERLGSRGHRYLHHAVDDYSQVVYSKILDDERNQSAAGFWTCANVFFHSLGVTVTAVMTDNGSCYRSFVFNEALTGTVKHRYTRPYRPQTNGKGERFNRTLTAEWAYARPYTSETEREAAYKAWLHTDNHPRPHTSIKGLTPAQRVHKLTGKYN